jgi:hypothetical protein
MPIMRVLAPTYDCRFSTEIGVSVTIGRMRVAPEVVPASLSACPSAIERRCTSSPEFGFGMTIPSGFEDITAARSASQSLPSIGLMRT